MGLDLFDIKIRIENAFQIEISDSELLGLAKKSDIVIGDLYEFVLNKMDLRDVGRNDIRLNEFLWLELRSALHTVTGTPQEQIQLSLALAVLFPRETRRAGWSTLRGVCPYKIQDLDYPQSVRRAGFVPALGVAVIELRHLWQVAGAKWFWPLLGLLASLIVGETYLKILYVFAPLRNTFPSGIRTVKDLCRSVLSSNYADICQDSNLSLDERCAAVWTELVEVLANVIGVAPASVTFRSRLMADLGAD